MGPMLVAAAVIIRAGRLLVVSKTAAPDGFYLPGGKPEHDEPMAAALHRELWEELGVEVLEATPFTVVTDVAALERVPMRMTVYLAIVDGEPVAAAELASLAWITADNAPHLAPAVRNQVVPRLVAAGLLGGTPTDGFTIRRV